MRMKFTTAATALAFMTTILTTGCKKNNDDHGNYGNQNNFNYFFYALTNENTLLKYDGSRRNSPAASVVVTGLQPEEKLLAIDFRPATGQLYGVGSTSRLYVINYTTGVAVAVGATSFTPALAGNNVGFDFNPTVDRIRLVTSTGQNIRLNPETGAVAAVDANLNPGTPGVNSVAYTNNFAGATTTVLYDIDPLTDKLYMQNPPNNGTLVEVGNLGEDIIGEGGFDISPDNQYAIAALTEAEDHGSDGEQKLYRVNLTTGKLSEIGESNKKIIGLAIPTNPVAYATDANNNLHIFNPQSPATTISKALTGLQAGETITGLDFRPATAQLFALGSTNRIYAINTATGAATLIGAGPFAAATPGVQYGFDFNPTVDRIRLVGSDGSNRRLNPITGTLAATDSTLRPGSPMVAAAAYTNSFAGATTTVLYDIDHGTDKLYTQNPPNNGVLVEVGALTVNIDGDNGFDIGGTSNKGYALLSNTAGTKLYTIDLATGKATATGSFAVKATAFAIGLGF